MNFTTDFDKFINYFTALSQLEKREELKSLLSTLSVDENEETVTFNDQKMFKYFGHLDSVSDMYTAIQTAPETRVLDGSVPIKITSRDTSFGMYDDEVSPVVEEILLEGKRIAPFHWTLTFTFNHVGETFVFCSITGEKIVNEATLPAPTRFTGTTFGPSVKLCLESILMILPSILGVSND